MPKERAAALLVPNGVMLVVATSVPGAIILRNVAGHGIIALSSKCTHRGCEVRPFPHSSQCPCHGSEFDQLGEVQQGPARSPLHRYSVIENEDTIIIKLG